MKNTFLSRISGFIQCRFKNRHEEGSICSLDPRAMELSATIAKLQEEKRKGTPT